MVFVYKRASDKIRKHFSGINYRMGLERFRGCDILIVFSKARSFIYENLKKDFVQ